MKRALKDIVKEIGEVDGKINSLLAKTPLSDEEEKELKDLDARADQLNAEREEAIAAQAEREQISARQAARQASLREPLEQPSSPVRERAVTSGLRERVADDPVGGFRNYGEFVSAVHEAAGAARNGGQINANLLALNSAYGNNADVGSEGGFLIPPEYSNRIIERAEGELPILGKCDTLTLAGNSVTVNGMADHDRSDTTYRNAGVVVYWVGEGDQITRSSLKFRQITLRPHKLAAISFVTDEELEGVANFGMRLMDKQGAGIREELVECVMFGTGVGQPMGALTGTSPCVEVSAETGQAADTIVAENIINMNSVIWSQSRGRGDWYYNGECLPQLETMSIAVGTGGMPAFWPAGGLSASAPAMIKGRPAYETDHCSALGDSGDIAFMDLSQYLLATKGTVQTALSIHLRFDYAESAFRSIFRVDGRPAWDTNRKPRKGASTRRVSPFVKLAARA